MWLPKARQIIDAMATKKNPLDAFVTDTPTANDFHVPELPKLAQLVKENGLMAGAGALDQAVEQWRQNLERTIIQRIAESQPVDLSKSGP